MNLVNTNQRDYVLESDIVSSFAVARFSYFLVVSGE